MQPRLQSPSCRWLLLLQPNPDVVSFMNISWGNGQGQAAALLGAKAETPRRAVQAAGWGASKAQGCGRKEAAGGKDKQGLLSSLHTQINFYMSFQNLE